MESHLPQAHPGSLHALTGHELHEFDLVVANARSMGWLSRDQQLSALRNQSSIVVQSLATDPPKQRTFEDGHRWLYQLLHELAQGHWKTQRPGSAADAILHPSEH